MSSFRQAQERGFARFSSVSHIAHMARVTPALAALLLVGCASAPFPAPESASDDATYVPHARAGKRRPRAEANAPAPASHDEADASAAPPAAAGSYEEALGRATSGANDEILPPSECGKPITPTLVMDCGVQGRVSVKLAIQNGHLIGVTADSEPRQPRVEACVLRQARAAEWRRVPGLTTCTRSFKIE
jgi:hypothetical protein